MNARAAASLTPLSSLLLIASLKPLITSFKYLLHFTGHSLTDILMYPEKKFTAYSCFSGSEIEVVFNHKWYYCSTYTVCHYITFDHCGYKTCYLKHHKHYLLSFWQYSNWKCGIHVTMRVARPCFRKVCAR